MWSGKLSLLDGAAEVSYADQVWSTVPPVSFLRCYEKYYLRVPASGLSVMERLVTGKPASLKTCGRFFFCCTLCRALTLRAVHLQ